MGKREDNLNKKKALVVEAAEKVFSKHSVEAAKMIDIANEANIGVASVYRYFETKGDIVVEVGIKKWNHVIDEYLKKDLYENMTGLEALETLLSIYSNDSDNSNDRFRFLEEFDNYIVNLENKPKNMKNYEDVIYMLDPFFESIILKGQKDGSIKPDLDPRKTHLLINHTLTALKQKLCLRGSVISRDLEINPVDEISYLIEIFTEYIKNK